MEGIVPEIQTAGVAKERPDIGSALTVVFTPKFNAVVVAPTKDEEVPIYKCPCGKGEYIDIPGEDSVEFIALVATLYGGATANYDEIVKAVASGERLDYRDPLVTNETSPEYANFVSAIAKNCALRELQVEADIKKKQFIGDTIEQLEYTRSFWKWDSKLKVRKFLRQFHFYGVLEKQELLSKNCTENAEMGDPEYWDPVDVLKWDTTKETGKKFNPFHQIAVALALIKLRDDGMADAVPDFANLLKRIDEAGFALDEYPDFIKGKIERREL